MASVVWSIVLFASTGGAIWLAHWMAPERVVGDETFERRPATPQSGAANGTGVECKPSREAADAAVLPRSPMAPAGVGDPRPPAPVGHRKRVVLHG